jgi:hypothetical protein
MDSVDKVISNWPFFVEGLGELNQIVEPVHEVNSETLLKVLCDTTNCANDGYTIIVRNPKGEPLQFVISFNNTTGYHTKRSLLVYATYSNRKDRGVHKFVIDWMCKWAKEQGYNELHAFSSRINGSGFRLFEKYFGFQRRMILFTRSL